jgi:predicted acetyltransferase
MTEIRPLNMHSGPIKLTFEKLVEVEPGGELVPFYHFTITGKDGTKVGHINFKVGDTNHVRQCVGHIGYEILPEYRGNSYSYSNVQIQSSLQFLEMI